MKAYEYLNESVNNINLDEGIFSFLGRNLVAKPLKWAGRKISGRAIRKFSRSNPNEFNVIKGGYFSGNFDDLNKRFINSPLGDFIEKDSNGKVRLNKLKLTALKDKDPELFNQIMTLNQVVAQANNNSWFRLSRSRKNAIEDALSKLEFSSMMRGNLNNPINSEVLDLVSKHNPDLINKYKLIAQNYDKLVKSSPLGVAGNRSNLIDKRKNDLLKLAGQIYKIDLDMRHKPSKYEKPEPSISSDLNIEINKKIKQNQNKIGKKTISPAFDYGRKA